MNKIKYIFQRVKSMNFKKMLNTAKRVSKINKKNIIKVLLDIIYCGYKYMAGYVDYEVFKMYNLDKEKRATYITRGINNNYMKILNNDEEVQKMYDKMYFIKHFQNFLKRDVIYLEESSFYNFEKFVKKHKVFIAKPTKGTCGKGVIKVKIEDGEDLQKLYDNLKQNEPLLEECITSHKDIAKLNPSSLNTIRVVTILKEDKVNIMFVGLKIGNGKPVDNFNSDGLLTIVDDDGVVRKPAINKKGEVFTKHPLTNENIINFKVPRFEEALNLSKECAKLMPKVRYIGFDIAITDDTTLIIEANPFPGHDLYQAVPNIEGNYEGLKPKFDKVIFNK